MAAHVASDDKGFRPSEYKFFIELLSNWMGSFYAENLLEIQNTQAIRALRFFETRSIVRKQGHLYFVTAGGLVESASMIAAPAQMDKLQEFFF